MDKIISNFPADARPDDVSYQQLTERVRTFLEAASAGLQENTSLWVNAIVGGLYRPDCAEDRRVQESWYPAVREFILDGQLSVSTEQAVELASPAHRLYYDIYKRFTSVEFFDLRLAGTGMVMVAIVLDDGYRETVIKEVLVQLDKSGHVVESVSPDALSANGSLFFRIKALRGTAVLSEARWMTRTRRNFVKAGLRVVAIRTFGNRGAVSASLQKTLVRLRQVDEAAAQRHVFLIYDCSPNRTTQPILTSEVNANILDVKGPNLGGGGNASLLASLLIEASDEAEVNIEELVICDDDAQYDAESLLRNDAFVLSRSKPCISTAIVCSQRNPEIVQEAGGIWGRFFDRSIRTIALDKKDSPQNLFPYLVRATRNLAERHNWS